MQYGNIFNTLRCSSTMKISCSDVAVFRECVSITSQQIDVLVDKSSSIYLVSRC